MGRSTFNLQPVFEIFAENPRHRLIEGDHKFARSSTRTTSLQTPFTSSGGSALRSTESSGVGGTDSPSSQSTPGGGSTLQDCTNFWDSE
jgi:hypothetical protein